MPFYGPSIAVADSYLDPRAGLQTTNYGTEAQLLVTWNGISTFLGFRAVFRFDLTSIAAGSTADSFTLWLYTNTQVAIAGASTWDLRVRRILEDDWTENGVSWTNRVNSAPTAWTDAGADTPDSATDTDSVTIEATNGGSGWESVDVTALVQQALTDGKSYLDIVVLDDLEGTGGEWHSVPLASREDATNKPNLEGAYTEPAAGGIAHHRRRIVRPIQTVHPAHLTW